MISFHLRAPPTLKRTHLGGGVGGLEGGLVYTTIMCNINSGVFNSIVGNSKMISIFILEYHQPLQGRPWREGVGSLDGV